MNKIFISYRRQDTKAVAGRIYDRLVTKFGREAVFVDIDAMPFGVDFHDYLTNAVSKAEVALALIGPGWVDAKDEAGNRRLENPDDFVRIEIEAALSRNIPFGPVLIDGAPMPRPEQLPEKMRALCRRNAALLDSGRDFHMHMDRLIAELEHHLSARQEQIEDTEFDVVLIDGGHGHRKIATIKEVRTLAELGLKDAKDLVESVPKVIKAGVSQMEAELIRKKLEAVGATVKIIPSV